MSKWLSRLSFSFLIIAAVLVFEGQKRNSQLHYLAAIPFVILGLAGIRERHRKND